MTTLPTVSVLLAACALPASALAGDPRNSMDSPSPITAVDREELEQSGLSDIAQIIGTLPNPGALGTGRVRGGAVIQTRYSLSLRDEPGLGDDETTLGFSMPRAELTLQAEAIENVQVILSGDAGLYGDGDFRLESGVINITIRDNYAAQLGQFRPAIRREEMVHESRLGGISRSVTNEFFTTRYHQGVQFATLRDDAQPFAWSAFFSDGPDSANTGFDSGNEFDYAFGGRLEWKPFGRWDQFIDVTSFRGADRALLLGFGGWYASDGDTNPSSVNGTTLCGLSADASYEDDGWRLGGTFDWFREDVDGQPEFDFLGGGIEGGVFVSPQIELHARLEQICLDEDLNLPTDEFLFGTFGLTHFLVPDSHAAKISADVVWAFDETASKAAFGVTNQGPVGSNSIIGLQGSSEDNEVLFRLQFQAVF